ncbi:MAG: reverse transcriptase domain-containing protein [Rhizonema sp. NSF051]|nr:reverse transcriptase domain-containing protein [Rhizonema sp. NSF051]
MVRHSHKVSELWKNLPWKKFRRELFRLQIRLFKAVKAEDMRKARSLQKLILKSQAARFLAIRQVTQLNAGRKTAGTDGLKSLSCEERFQLEENLKKNYRNWEHSGLREIPIPKKDGKIRILKVPTIAYFAWQCLAKYALEPAHEATSHANSYGFRAGRSAHDAQKRVFNLLNSSQKGKDKRVIELDIEKCFDRISHKTIMDELIAPLGLKVGIFRCLKAGVNPEFPEQGTPQGGVVSPVLANIALNGIEEIFRYHKNGFNISDKTPPQKTVTPSIRYADDMVIIIRPQDDAEEILERINQFLAARGMNVSPLKTKITAATDGFDFLGWHFKVQSNGKFKCVPSADNFRAFRKKVKAIINCPNYGSKVKAQKLAPIVRGWREYHKYCDMSGTRDKLWFINHRAFQVFNKETKNDKHTSRKLVEEAFPKVPWSENAYSNVSGGKSPYDGDLTYWSERNSKLYDGPTSKALKRQNHTCDYCGLRMLPGEKTNLHHVDGNHQNWKINNLVAIHESCHDYIHMSLAKA